LLSLLFRLYKFSVTRQALSKAQIDRLCDLRSPCAAAVFEQPKRHQPVDLTFHELKRNTRRPVRSMLAVERRTLAFRRKYRCRSVSARLVVVKWSFWRHTLHVNGHKP
jgi:hypothetical protein